MPKCDVNMEKYIYEDITEIKTQVGYFWLVMEMLTSLFQQKKMNITFKFNLGREPVTNANYLVKKIKQDQGTGRDVGGNAIS